MDMQGEHISTNILDNTQNFVDATGHNKRGASCPPRKDIPRHAIR